MHPGARRASRPRSCGQENVDPKTLPPTIAQSEDGQIQMAGSERRFDPALSGESRNAFEGLEGSRNVPLTEIGGNGVRSKRRRVVPSRYLQ